MLLESLEYVSEDGGMTVLGDVLKDTPHKFQEPVLVALELMKFGLLSGEPFDPAQGQVWDVFGKSGGGNDIFELMHNMTQT